MGKQDDFWSTLPQDSEGQILWPEDASQRLHLVRAAFGAEVIGAVEAVVDERLEVAAGQPPAPGSANFAQEAARRRLFAAMSAEQRLEVQKLIRGACFETLYWILVKLEHFPLGDVDFRVVPYTPDGRAFPAIGIEETELQQLYFGWVERFSEQEPE